MIGGARLLALATAGILLAMAPAFPHALLMESVPAPRAVVPAPDRLLLRFNSRIEKTLSSARLLRSGAAPLPLAPAETGGVPEQLVFPLPRLDPGDYRAHWRVLSADGHVTEGTVPFRVAGAPRVIDLAIAKRALPPGQRLLRLRQGEEITLRFTTDEPLTIHVHGYDLERAVRPGVASVLIFQAGVAGRFAISMHGAREVTLGYLEVHPR
jgi:methionine-rich copper-binding protein CopC